jgi:hypothetical protein
MLRRLMELILPVEQQVYGATLDPTPTLGPPLPPNSMLRYWLAGGGKFWNQYCQSTLYWGEGGSSCTKHPNDVSIISYTKICHSTGRISSIHGKQNGESRESLKAEPTVCSSMSLTG